MFKKLYIFGIILFLFFMFSCDKKSTTEPKEPEDEITKTILADILALIDQKYHGIIIGIVKANITLPEIGFEYMKDSAIVAQAEMAWPTKKIVLLHKSDYKYEDIFLQDKH